MIEEESLVKEKIMQIIHKKNKHSQLCFERDNLNYLSICVLDLILLGIYFSKSFSSPILTYIGLITGFLLLFTTSFSLYNLLKFQKFKQMDISIADIVEQQSRYFNREYQIWLIIKPISILIFTFFLSAIMDMKEGSFKIVNKGIYVGIYASLYLIGYLTSRVISQNYVDEYIKTLRAMQQEIMLEEAISAKKKTKLFVLFFITILLLITLILIFLKYL